MRLWLAIASYRNDEEVLRILESAHSGEPRQFERILVVDSEGTGIVPARAAEHGWRDVLYRSYARNLGSGANLCERLRLAANGGADFVLAINHDGTLERDVVAGLCEAASAIGHLGAAYPLGYLTKVGLYNLTGTRELPLPAKLVATPPREPLIDVHWSSSNGALYSTAPARRGVLPWAELWMGWEDLEYGWRLADHGFRQVVVRGAVFRDNYEYRHTLFGRVMGKPAWRSYYYARNLVLAVRRSRNRPLYHAVAGYKIMREGALTILSHGSKLERLRLLLSGTIDGWRWDEWDALAEVERCGTAEP
jgi:GT2 family glycosyltransferase